MFGGSLEAISIEHCHNLDDIRKAIREGAAARPTAPRLLVQGWMLPMTNSRALASNLNDLDARPIYIYAKDLRSAWCNTAALDEMEITAMSDPGGGEIVRDESGKPSGLMSEAAVIQIVWSHLAKAATREDKLSQVRKAIRASQCSWLHRHDRDGD